LVAKWTVVGISDLPGALAAAMAETVWIRFSDRQIAEIIAPFQVELS
jgi:hypothetical protein